MSEGKSSLLTIADYLDGCSGIREIGLNSLEALVPL